MASTQQNQGSVFGREGWLRTSVTISSDNTGLVTGFCPSLQSFLLPPPKLVINTVHAKDLSDDLISKPMNVCYSNVPQPCSHLAKVGPG